MDFIYSGLWSINISGQIFQAIWVSNQPEFKPPKIWEMIPYLENGPRLRMRGQVRG